MSQDATISITKLSVILEAASRRGIDVAAWRQGLEWDGAQDSIERHTSMAAYLALWARAMRAVRDPAFPLQVAATPVESLSLVGLLVMTCATIEEALTQGMRFERLWMSDGRWEILSRSPQEVILGWSAPLGSARGLGERACAEAALASMVWGMRALSGRQVIPLRATLAHPAPSPLHAHLEFFGPSLSFQAPADTLAVPAQVLTWPLLHSNPAVARYLQGQCDALMARLDDPRDVAARLRRVILNQVSDGQLTRASVARHLGMSERTLLRRLQEQGTTFRQVLDDARCAIAHGLLAQGHWTVAQVAGMTGFASPSAFHRAYRRWNQPPSDE